MSEHPEHPGIQKLREEETSQAPAFERMWMRAESQPPASLAEGISFSEAWRGWAAFGALAVIPVIAAVFWMTQSAQQPAQSVEWSRKLDDLEVKLRAESSDWTSLRSPSDYLLASRQESNP